LGFLAGKFFGPANSFAFLAHSLFRRLLVGLALFHFAKYAFALHLLFQYPQCLFDIVISYENAQWASDLTLTGIIACIWVRI
jgi:hypothetical protein